MTFRSFLFLAALVAVSNMAAASMSMERCSGSAMYKIVFKNLLTPERFGDKIPETGLVFSPLAGASHSNRQSFLTIRGFASRPVEEIAETGNNARFLKRANRLRRRGEGVRMVAGAEGPTLPGGKTVLRLRVDCEHPFVTVLGMIAPSPDWIVQINNRNLYNEKTGKFVRNMTGDLIAYDAGTDSGRDFTAPDDPSLDQPTEPVLNIAPLVEDETDRFMGRIVGKFVIKRVD